MAGHKTERVLGHSIELEVIAGDKLERELDYRSVLQSTDWLSNYEGRRKPLNHMHTSTAVHHFVFQIPRTKQ